MKKVSGQYPPHTSSPFPHFDHDELMETAVCHNVQYNVQVKGKDPRYLKGLCGVTAYETTVIVLLKCCFLDALQNYRHSSPLISPPLSQPFYRVSEIIFIYICTLFIHVTIIQKPFTVWKKDQMYIKKSAENRRVKMERFYA